MPTLNIKNVPDDLYERLKERAEVHRRSINKEAILCLRVPCKAKQRIPSRSWHA